MFIYIYIYSCMGCLNIYARRYREESGARSPGKPRAKGSTQAGVNGPPPENWRLASR